VLSLLFTSPLWAFNVGGAEEACVVAAWAVEVKDEVAGGVEPGGIFRIKFMGALGFASEREKSPEADVAEGGNGCCAWVFMREELAFECGGTYAWIGCAFDVGGKIGIFGCSIVACMRSETSCCCGSELRYVRFWEELGHGRFIGSGGSSYVVGASSLPAHSSSLFVASGFDSSFAAAVGAEPWGGFILNCFL
jgi:hypothetical protein